MGVMLIVKRQQEFDEPGYKLRAMYLMNGIRLLISEGVGADAGELRRAAKRYWYDYLKPERAWSFYNVKEHSKIDISEQIFDEIERFLIAGERLK